MIGRFLLATGLSLGLAASALADPGMTGAPVTMRAAPTVNSRVVQHIPANAEIDLSSCDRGWCYASWRNLFGYIPADVVAARPPQFAVGPPVVAAPPVVVAPAWGWGGPYVGAGWGYGWRRW
jgi:uncharacterized protein YraI